MIAARIERLEETVTTKDASLMLGDPMLGDTVVTTFELGVNYWYSRRFRATFNYVMNHLDGDTGAEQAALKLTDGNRDEHEFLLRLAVAL
jgi:hypothetical protein